MPPQPQVFWGGRWKARNNGGEIQKDRMHKRYLFVLPVFLSSEFLASLVGLYGNFKQIFCKKLEAMEIIEKN